MSYAQDGEDAIVAQYFRERGVACARLLDIGAFDGRYLSNSRLLIEAGWTGVLVEASLHAFRDLLHYYGGNEQLQLVHAAIGGICEPDGLIVWHEHSKPSPAGPRVASAASTSVAAQARHMQRIDPQNGEEDWRRYWLPHVSVQRLLLALPPPFMFVSIDTEGTSIDVLEAMDLEAMGTRVVCVEHNEKSDSVPDPGLHNEWTRAVAHCGKYGLGQVLFDNGVNMICGA